MSGRPMDVAAVRGVVGTSLTDKLASAIAAQQQEVARLVDVAKVALPQAQARLKELTDLAASKQIAVIDAAIETLKTHGIRLDT